jgi:predicted pyridoxine 5'-phosphate oxidase superfamily flavin-nucleotide-binding protein
LEGGTVEVLTEEMKNLVSQVRLCYAATASKDGMPNVSPKGSIIVVDDNTLAFACMMSPKTVSNLKENPKIAVAVVDAPARKGFQFKGKAVLETSGKIFEQMSARIAGMKLPPLQCVARITVSEIVPIPTKA